jgi:broad specificity phosphatase PhoE
MTEAIIAASEKYAKQHSRKPEFNPFQLPAFPPKVIPKQKDLRMAMDQSMSWAGQQWAGGIFSSVASEGIMFLGYPYLAELAQRPEYRVISETIADDATRKWIDFEVTGNDEENKRRAEQDPEGEAERMADPDERKKRIAAAGKTDKVKALKDDQARLEVRDKFYNIARDDGFFGRSHLFLNFGTDLDLDTSELKTDIGDGRNQMSQAKVGRGKFKELKVVEAVWTYPTTYNAVNPLRDDWYNPQVWYVMGKEAHASRLLTFIGHPVPDLLKPAYSFGGLALSQMAKPYVDIWLTTRQSVADLIHSFSVMVLMTDLQTVLQPGNADALIARAAMFNALRDNQGLMMINKATEDFKNVSASMAGLHELQAQAQEHVASVARIPLVKFTGIQPSGLNATSDGEIKVYDDTISAYQNRFFRPHLTRVVNFEQLSLWEEVDPEISIVFEPLRQLTDKEQGDKQKAEAERDQIYVDMGALAPKEVRKRIVNDPELPYADLDAEDAPDLRQEEIEGLEPKGGRPDPLAEQHGLDAALTRTILMVRHGATSLNNEDVSVDRIRGWKDIPLSPDGEAEAKKLGQQMSDDPPDVIVTSDLKRAADTAEIISEITGVPVKETTKDLRPWNCGKYSGWVTSEAVPILADYATDRPDEKVPGGESFDDFAKRFFCGLAEIIQKYPGKIAVVTHHRDERLLKAWIANGSPSDGEIDKSVFCKKGEHTGAVMDIDVPVANILAAARNLTGIVADAEFKESDHPRALDGKFGSGGGGSKSSHEGKAGKLETSAAPAIQPATAPYKAGIKAFGLEHAEAQKVEWKKTAPKSAEDILKVSPANQEALAKACEKAAAKVKTNFANPGAKSEKRLLEKIAGGRSAESVTDAVRGGFNVDTPEDGDKIIHMLAQDFEVADEGWQKNGTGYFDRKTMVRFADGQVGEIQMWPPGMFEAKETGSGHHLYEKWRTLPKGSAHAQEIEQQMIDIYAKVEAALPAVWKSLFRKSGEN